MQTAYFRKKSTKYLVALGSMAKRVKYRRKLDKLSVEEPFGLPYPIAIANFVSQPMRVNLRTEAASLFIAAG